MAREKVGGRIAVRLGDGVPERIDAVVGAGGRSDFIRDAVLEKLDGRAEASSSEVGKIKGPHVTAIPQNAVVRAPANISVPDTAPDARPEFAVLLAHLKKAGLRSEREAARDLGWPEGKVKAAAKGLTDAGLIAYERGSMMVQA